MRKWIVMFLAFLCFTLGFSTVWASQVVDESDVLTAEQETELNNSLSEFTSWSRQEMDILILPEDTASAKVRVKECALRYYIKFQIIRKDSDIICASAAGVVKMSVRSIFPISNVFRN